MSNVRQIPRQEERPHTRKLTGQAPWPMVLLAGGEKVGKTWSAVQGCMSDLVAGGLWFPIGENDPDEYALIPGFSHDRFDLALHDGTYRGLLAELDYHLAVERTNPPAKPLLWVLDSGSRLWDLLSNMAQREMYDRLAKKAAAQNRAAPDTEQKPAVDLWNVAADRWSHIVDALRQHNGPVVITGRMEFKTVMSPSGEPTREKEAKILTHKSLPSDVDAIVELTAPGEAVLTGVRSVKLAGIGKRVDFKDFSVDLLLRRLGLDLAAGQRSHTGIDAEDKPAREADVARTELRQLAGTNGWNLEAIAAEYADQSDGTALKDATSATAIRAFGEWLTAGNWPPKQATA